MTFDGGKSTLFILKSVRLSLAVFIVLTICTSSAAGFIYNTNLQLSGNNVHRVEPSVRELVRPAFDAEPEYKTATITLVYSFEQPSIYNAGYDHIEMEGMLDLDNEGEPVLPFRSARVLIPPFSTVTGVEAQPGTKITIPGGYKIVPAGKPMPLSEMTEYDYDPVHLEPDETVYGSSDPYPGMTAELVTTERFRGYDIAFVNLFPVQYIPAYGSVYYYESLTLKVEYQTEVDDRSLSNRLRSISSFRNLEADSAEVADMVDNPTTVSSYVPERSNTILGFGGLNASAVWDMVIITNNSLNTTTQANYTFADLAKYRNDHGIKTTIMTVENITANPKYWNTTKALFNDTAAQIRNFIIDAYYNWGITYVLLGGDGDGKDVGGESGDNIIPGRGLTCSGDFIMADLYYSGLDGNWNNDEDSNWGEYPIEEDLMGEVYVGRAPVDSPKELENFVRKTLHYETTNSSYLNETLMVGEFLWAPSTYAGDYMDEIVEGSDMHGYSTVGIPHDNYTIHYNISTLYDRDWPVTNRWPKSALIDIINNETHVIHHLGHSNTLYTLKLVVSDVAKFNNTEYFFGYSQGCYPGAFDNRGTSATKYYDTDAIVEHIVLDEFGAFAFIANSRYGYGVVGSTNGASQRYHRQFVDALFGEDMLDIGRANQDSKHDNIAYVGAPVNLWCYYEINLFGDPSVELRAPKPPEHDVSIAKLAAPTHVAPSTQITINATILNRGFCNETGILVNFTVDGSTVSNHTISKLDSLETTDISFNWTPILGIYDIAVEIQPVFGETILDNNRREAQVIVEPDVAVPYAQFSEPIWLKEKTPITAQVDNIGRTNVSDVKVILFVDSTEVFNTTITKLAAESSTNVTLNWTPQAAGDRAISIFAVNLSNEHSVDDNYYNETVTVKVHPRIDWNPVSFDLTVNQNTSKAVSLTLYNNGTSGLYYDFTDFATNGQHRKIALISDLEELTNITDTLDQMGFHYTIYNNNTVNKYTEDYDELAQYGLVIFYSASRALSLNEKLTLDRYITEHGGNLIVTGYDSLGSPTDYRMAFVVRSQNANDGPWSYDCTVTDANHPIMNGPFGKLGSGATFYAVDYDHDRAVADASRGSKAIATVSGNAKILVTDSIGHKSAKVVYWNGNRYTQDWDAENSDAQMLFMNLLVWAADDGRPDWLTESPVSGLVDFDDSGVVTITADAAELEPGNYYRKMVIASNDTDKPWVMIPVNLNVPVPDHDVAVYDMTGPASLAINIPGTFNATLENIASKIEYNVNVELRLDGVVVDTQTIGQLNPSASTKPGFLFTPNSSVTEGEHAISIRAVPVSGENATSNNIATLPVTIITEAELDHTPDSFSLRGRYDETVTDNLTVVNNGTGPMDAYFGTYRLFVEEQFKTTTLDTSLWTKSGSPAINTWGLSEPSGPYSLNLDSMADIVESIEFDLANATYGEISFYVELGGVGYRPRETAWLHLEYNASNGTWQPLWERQGYGTYTGYRLGNTTYDFYLIVLPADAFHAGFKFRFRTEGLNNGYDDWLIDDIRFDCLGFDDWLYLDSGNASVLPYGGNTKTMLTANLTSHSMGVYHKSLYIKSNDDAVPVSTIPVEITVLGDLDHIHMSHSVWFGTADDSIMLFGTGHDLLHHEVEFQQVWSTTDPNGTVVNGLYNPGKTGTWKVYCNNTNNSISNFTTVTISTGNLARIEIVPGTWSGSADEVVDFAAKGYDEDDNEMVIGKHWSVDDPKGIISQSGQYRAGKVGTWTVTCTNASTGVEGNATVTVTGPAALLKITVTPAEHTMTTDDSFTFTATLVDKYDNVISTPPAWAVTGGGTIDTGGKYTPDTIGIYTVTASSGDKMGTAKVIVNTGALASLELTPISVELTAGEQQQFSVKGYDADGNVRPAIISWAATGGGTISTAGLYKATTTGDWTVYANSSGLSVSASVTVSPGPLKRLELTPEHKVIAAGAEYEFTVRGYDAFDNIVELTPGDIFWSAPKDAGEFKSPAIFLARKVGTWTLTAVNPDTGVNAHGTVEITPGPLSYITVSPAKITVKAGSQVQYSSQAFDEFDNPIPDLDYKWHVSGGCSIDHGLLTAMWAERIPYLVYAEVMGDLTETFGTAEIMVLPGDLVGLGIEPEMSNLTAGESEQFRVYGYDEYGNYIPPEDLEIAFSTTGGGTITEKGLYTAKTAGAWMVTATSGSISIDAKVNVIPSMIARLEVAPSELTMYIDEKAQFLVKAYDEYDNVVSDGYSVQWAVAEGSGQITASGLFTATKTGTWDVTASMTIEDTTLSSSATVIVMSKADTDSDGDGLPDVWEERYGLDPNDPADAGKDSDGDGASALLEFQAGTDPTTADTDEDSLPDGWELMYGLDPLDGMGENGNTGDPDQDGYTNLAEYTMSTDPRDGADPAPKDPTGTIDTDPDEKKGSVNALPFIALAVAVCVVIVLFFLFLRKKKPEVSFPPIDSEPPGPMPEAPAWPPRNYEL